MKTETDWKKTFNEDLAAEQFHQNLVDGKLSEKEQKDFENVKEAFNEDMSKFLEN